MERLLQVEGDGKACLHMEGTSIKVSVERTDDHVGLYKAWLWGGRGEQIMIGTLVPESGMLKRKRRFSVKELESGGCWPVKGCRIELAFPFEDKKWYCEQNPERLISDSVLKGQIKGAMMCCRRENRVWLAVPFRKEQLVMLDAAFCFGRVEMIHESPYIIWEFDRAGLLILP